MRDYKVRILRYNQVHEIELFHLFHVWVFSSYFSLFFIVILFYELEGLYQNDSVKLIEFIASLKIEVKTAT